MAHTVDIKEKSFIYYKQISSNNIWCTRHISIDSYATDPCKTEKQTF
jgi:hypothetical protein